LARLDARAWAARCFRRATPRHAGRLAGAVSQRQAPTRCAGCGGVVAGAVGAPVTGHLLSPAGRPIQVTQDLKGFWERTYPEVKKELKGHYPRHPWPDDPWSATPTHRAKPRGS